MTIDTASSIPRPRAAFLADAAGRLRRLWARRRTLHALAALDGPALSDIGVTRASAPGEIQLCVPRGRLTRRGS